MRDLVDTVPSRDLMTKVPSALELVSSDLISLDFVMEYFKASFTSLSVAFICKTIWYYLFVIMDKTLQAHCHFLTFSSLILFIPTQPFATHCLLFYENYSTDTDIPFIENIYWCQLRGVYSCTIALHYSYFLFAIRKLITKLINENIAETCQDCLLL